MIVKLNSFGLLGIKGNDAVKFLQGQISCDVSKITESNSSLAVHADPKGRILSLFRIFLKDDTYLLQLPKESLKFAKNALEKYKVFYKSTLEDVTDQYDCFGFIDEPFTDTHALPDHENNCVTAGNATLLFWSGKHTRYEVILPVDTHEHSDSDDEPWRLCDIEYGYPQVYPKTTEKLLPHYLNLNELDALSFTKGCYTGQEIIARMEHLGKLKKKMYYLKGYASELPELGSSLYHHEKRVGTIINAMLDKHELHLLAILPISKSEETFYLDETLKDLLTVSELKYRS